MSWTNEHLEPHLHTLVMELRRLREDLRTPEAVEAAVYGITPALEILEAHLADNAFVAGDRFSMGDIPVGAAGAPVAGVRAGGSGHSVSRCVARNGSRSARDSGATSRRRSCMC